MEEEEGEQDYPHRARPRKPAYDSMDPAVEEDYASRHRTQIPISKPVQQEQGEEEGGGRGGYTYKTHRPPRDDTIMDQQEDQDYTSKKKNYTNQPTHHEPEEEEEEEEEGYSNRNTRKPAYNATQRKEEYEEEDYSYNKNTEKPTHAKEASSSSDALSSAKYLAEAAQHAFRHETDMIDRSRVAGAAEGLLEAASRYGKLEEKGFGQYIDKAESYLQQYHSSTDPAAHGGGDHSSRPSHGGGGGGGEEHKAEGGGGGSGYGDYLKMAEGFLKKY